MGDELTIIPATQERFRFLASNEDLVRVDWWLPEGGGSPRHVHPCQVERVTGIEGELAITWRGGEVVVGPGQSFSVPAGLVHAFANRSPASAHMIVDFLPALRMREFFETVAGLANEGRTDAAGRPRNPLLMATFVRTYRRSFAVAMPPRQLQALLMTPLAKVADLVGIRAHQDSYLRPVVDADFDVDAAVRDATPRGLR